jgi:hypothetical protein
LAFLLSFTGLEAPYFSFGFDCGLHFCPERIISQGAYMAQIRVSTSPQPLMQGKATETPAPGDFLSRHLSPRGGLPQRPRRYIQELCGLLQCQYFLFCCGVLGLHDLTTQIVRRLEAVCKRLKGFEVRFKPAPVSARRNFDDDVHNPRPTCRRKSTLANLHWQGIDELRKTDSSKCNSPLSGNS